MDEMNTECILSLVFVYVCVGVADSRKRGGMDGFVSSSEKPKNREKSPQKDSLSARLSPIDHCTL